MDRTEYNDDKLDALWAAYRDACPDPEPSAGFTPGLWKRIEARRSTNLMVFRRLAQLCAGATLALTVLMGLVLIPHLEQTPAVSTTYADALAAEHPNTYVDIFAGEIK
ncbi:MAG TPA: hypothetical protein VMB85_23600 [Bryobacteraceae bacterium]|jgi:hypothetical protein|nr:hypothetical protein [Bryobacteraceae bacterium]